MQNIIIQYITILLLFIQSTISTSTSPLPTQISTTITSTNASSRHTNSASTTSYSNNSDEFSDRATSALPILKFFQGNNYFFDYIIEVGEPQEQMALRLDLLQGDVWLPATNEFVECSSARSSSLTTTIPVDTNLIPTITSSETTSSNVTYLYISLSTSSDYSTVTVDMVDTVYVQACASSGVYNLLNSLTGSFIDITTNLLTDLANATYYSFVSISGIFLSGNWATDNFILSYLFDNQAVAIEMFDVPFVYANFSNVGVGSLALGSTPDNHVFNYNFISNFVLNNLIKTNSYSLALDAKNSSAPQLILGGINKDFVQDNLSSNENNQSMALFDFVPVFDETGTIIKSNNGISNSMPVIPIFGWGVTSTTNGDSLIFSSSYNDRYEVSQYPKPAVLDSRHSYNYIPYSTLIEMAIELNAVYSSDLDRWIVDCSVDRSGTMDLHLGNYTIHMPISNFLYPATSNQTNLVFNNGNPACFLAFLPDYRIGYSLMGVPFLKNIYLAVDNENQQIAVSQLKNQLSDLNLDISSRPFSMEVDIENFEKENNEIEVKNVNETKVEPKIKKRETTQESDHKTQVIGMTTLSAYKNTVSLERVETITSSNTIYETTVTISDDPFFTKGFTGQSFYAIESGTIPYAKRFVNITDLTLTIPRSIELIDYYSRGTEIYISDDEVYLQTDYQTGTDGDATTMVQRTTDSSTQIYGFSSYVSSISSRRMSGAGYHVEFPIKFYSFTKSYSLSLFCFLAFFTLFTIVLM